MNQIKTTQYVVLCNYLFKYIVEKMLLHFYDFKFDVKLKILQITGIYLTRNLIQKNNNIYLL